ncbi:hypothetical protein [Streptomyces katrae]|uniref:hypothetical protein n=1 Tax=Streptomyces katrae TaxID=68223 RepID=UPI000A4376AE|nr:hypothetical protein [Streptomyces katrae]
MGPQVEPRALLDVEWLPSEPRPRSPTPSPASLPTTPVRTRDLGGSASTGEFTSAILKHL